MMKTVSIAEQAEMLDRLGLEISSEAINRANRAVIVNKKDDEEPPFIDEAIKRDKVHAGLDRVFRHPVKIVPIRSDPKIRRNDPCPCGSDLKYKKCCLNK